jgi:hypothetical protein
VSFQAKRMPRFLKRAGDHFFLRDEMAGLLVVILLVLIFEAFSRAWAWLQALLARSN